MILIGGQIRAARGFLQWSAQRLADAAGIGLSTVQRAEKAEGEPALTRANLMAIRTALEAAGVEFIAENGGGAGVRLRSAPPA